MLSVSTNRDAMLFRLHEVQPQHAKLVGGKAMGLGKLFEHGFPVPPGFVLTVEAYRRTVDAAFTQEIKVMISNLDERSDNRIASDSIRDLFLRRGLDDETKALIHEAYAEIGVDVPVAVRSSATAEDAVDASFAGQQETFLWICGAEEVCRHVVLCWASLFSAQAIGYRSRFTIDTKDLAMAVVVQQMVDAAAAGVMFTLDPANGARETAYIEAAHGLGEVVVRGEVSPDRFHVDKNSGAVRAQIAAKLTAYRFNTVSGTVQRVKVESPEASLPSLSHCEAAELAALGARVEATFNRPMDIEWAIDNKRTIQLLQARPETVWSRKPTRKQVEVVIGRHDAWDPLNDTSAPSQYWTTGNVGEAMPGVMTPLSWTTWIGMRDGNALEGIESSTLKGLYSIGVISRRESRPPLPGQHRIRSFYGRVAIDPTLFIVPGDRTPGSSGRQIAEHIFGSAPDDIPYLPTRRRWPIIFLKVLWVALTIQGRLRRAGTSTDMWWTSETSRIAGLDKQTAISAYTEARRRFYKNIINQTIVLSGVVQPLYQLLEWLAAHTGVGSAGALAGGYGGLPEVAVVHDLWRASHGEISLNEVVRHHGYHGPMEGEISSRVWREDSSPLHKLMRSYATRGEESSPIARDVLRRKERMDTEAAMINAVPPWKRPLIRALLNFAARGIPLRGVAKNAFLQSFDVARAAARRVGECLAAEGILEHPEDVFMLTLAELERGPQLGISELVTRRKERHAAYQQLTIPTVWRGSVTPGFAADPTPGAVLTATLTGIGVSNGVVEGRARVLMEPDFAEVEPDEILVAPTTDPSWSSIMFISAGLVVDIGGAMSHAAVVARELDIPCVVNCLTGTQVIHSGDLIRIDGSAGTIEILEHVKAAKHIAA